MTQLWTLELQERENGEYFIQLNDEILKASGFKINDTLKWIDNNDGSFALKKVEDKVLVLVECIQQYRMRYVVEAPADHPEYALDTVVMEEAKEFSQLSLGETISSHRIIDEAEALRLCDQDNDYTKAWGTTLKLENFVTKLKD